ncbi:MAG: DNA repair and recombination protein RadA [Candidatus Hodarchaeales archaeon]|jgi:DNA repair protein RadA
MAKPKAKRTTKISQKSLVEEVTPPDEIASGTTNNEVAVAKEDAATDIGVATIPKENVNVTSSTLRSPAPLSELGIRPSISEKLNKAGITTTGVLATMSAKQVADLVAGVGDTIAGRLVRQARDFHGLGLTSGRLIHAQQKARLKISTGLTGLDNILDGGIESGVTTEFYGAFKSGKTQLCHQLSVMVQLPPERGGFGKACAWIDTEGTWYADRPVAIAEKMGLDPNKVLDNIYIARTYNSEEQIALTNEIIEKLEELNIGLIVIDSLISHFRGEYIGRGTLAERQQTIGNYLEMLQRPVSLAGVSVVITNQVSANPDPYAVGVIGGHVAVGGHVVAHSTTHRVYLKGKSKSVTAQIIDSPILKPEKCEFKITETGLKDV